MVDHSVGVGKDVITRCNKCELDLAHVVMAKVEGLVKRVKCNTCKSEHSLRGEAKLAAHKRRAAKPPMTQVVRVKNRVPHKPWKVLLYGRENEEAPAYAMTLELDKNGLVKHPSFGLGIVTELSDDKKRVSVLFESGEKVLALKRA